MQKYQLFVNLVISGAAFFTAWIIFQRRKDGRTDYPASNIFGWFWLITALLWIFNSVGNFLGVFKLTAFFLPVTFFYIAFLFAGLSGPVMIYYLILTMFNKKHWANFFLVIYIIGFLFFLFFLFNLGLEGRATEWGEKHPLPVPAFFMLSALIGGVALVTFYDFCRRILSWMKIGILKDGRLFLTKLSILLYLLGSYFDAQGTIEIWKILFFKLIILIGILISFTAFYFRFVSRREASSYEI